jgi:hypothetical protein
MQDRNKRPVLLFVVVFVVMILFTLNLVNNNVNLTGAAVVNASEEAVVNPPPPDQPEDVNPAESIPNEQPELPQNNGESSIPTAIPATAVPPTEMPPTPVENTPIPTPPPTDVPAEVTDIPTAAPEETDLPQPTSETTAQVELTPEATIIDESELTPEVSPEAIDEFELTPEVTPEATLELTQFNVAATCTDIGASFAVTNTSEGLPQAEIYFIDGVEVGEVMLAAGETITIQAGYGLPELTLAGMTFQPETPCNPPPQLAITMECTLDLGVVFVITNSGGAMVAEQPYTITQVEVETLGSFQLGEAEYIEIPAGYGTPALTTGELSAQYEPSCNPPSHIQGRIWNDTNGDSLYTEDEIGIAGVAVELVNADGFPFSVTTLEDGIYDFFPVAEGVYTVRPILNTLPPDVSNSADPDSTLDSQTGVNVVSSENYFLDFGYTIVASASINGVVWLETGNFAVHDGSETGLSGAVVQLVDANGVVVQEVTITTDGAYHFEALVAGTYTVQLVSTTLPQPYGVTFNTDGNNDLEIIVAVESGEAVNSVDFGIVGTF